MEDEMIQLQFKIKEEMFGFIVQKEKLDFVYPKFRMMKIKQYLPQDPATIKEVLLEVKTSRNAIPAVFISLFADIPAEDKAEFEANKHDEKALRDIVVKICKKHNCELVKEEVR